MRTRSTARNVVEYCVAIVVLKSLEWSPLPVAHWPARRYARLLDLAIPRLRRVARQNLAMALPEFTPAPACGNCRWRVPFHWRGFWYPSRNSPPSGGNRWSAGSGWKAASISTRRSAPGRGVLFATAHLGNWELSAFAHALLTGPMNVVVRPLDNPLIDRIVERRRALTGNVPIGKKDFARAILKALAANQAVGILIDQNASLDTGVFVDFFGVPACAGTGFAKFAAHSGAVGDPRLRAVERPGTALHPAFLSAAGDDRRYRQGYAGTAIQAGRSDPRVPGSVAVDTPPLEDTPARGSSRRTKRRVRRAVPQRVGSPRLTLRRPVGDRRSTPSRSTLPAGGPGPHTRCSAARLVPCA